jgi:hypothetical protein
MNPNLQVNARSLVKRWDTEAYMKELQRHLAKIRSDAAECHLLSNLATDGKRELFARLAQHLNALALEVEKTIATNGVAESAATAETPVSVSLVGSEGVELGPKGHADVAYAADHEQAGRSRRMLPWLLAIALVAIAGALLWGNHRDEKDASLVATLQSKAASSPALQDDAREAMAAVLSEQQRERKVLTEQLSALAARVDELEKARAEIAVQLTKQSVGREEKPTAAEDKPSTLEEKSVRTEEKSTSSLEKPAAAEKSNSDPKQSDGVPPVIGNPIIEPTDRVGAVSVPTRAELDPRKPTTGPAGCTHFRSFDPVSGTYTTVSGRKRECR